MKFGPVVRSTEAEISPRKRRVVVSKTERLSLIQGWQDSGLGRRVFCEKHNINLKTFSNWLKKCPDTELREETSKCEGQSGSRRPDWLEIDLPSGVHLRLPLSQEGVELPLIRLVLSCKFN